MTGAALAALIAGLATAMPAYAQKAKDTLRFAFIDPISTTADYFDAKPETVGVERSIYSTLLDFDPESRTFKPDLAVSWKRINPTTLEFKLRKGVTWQDGHPFTADDVVATVSWLLDPKTKLRFGYVYTSRFSKIEKVDDYTVRLHEPHPVIDDLVAVSTNMIIFPKHLFEKYEPRANFAREQPIGTGPYKAVFVSPSKGIMLEKWDGFVSPGPWRPAASIGKVEILPIPDLQTATAQLMTGGLEVMHDVPRDQATQLASDPRFALTSAPGLNVIYMEMDAAGRSGNKALTSLKVRRAMEMAVDRASLAKNVAPVGATVPNALCVPVMVGCGVDNAPPAFDLAAAKKLVAEAGYPNGFDVDIISQPGTEQIAEALAGQLRRIGVRAKVENLTFAGFRARQVAGKIEILVGQWDAAGRPHVAGTFAYLWGGGPGDYARDETLIKLGKEASSERDQAKSDAIYRKMFDRINDKAYLLPLTTFPAVFVHNKDVWMPKDVTGALATDFFRMKWQ